MQFDRAEYNKPEPLACVVCQRALNEQYFTVNGKPACEACTGQIRESLVLTFEGFLKAAVLGLGAAIVGGLLWGGIREATGYDVGIVAIGVGYLIGEAVRRGAGGGKGWPTQLLAAAMTYFAIGVSLAISMVFSKEFGAEEPFKRAFIIVAALVGGPILESFASVILLLINGFALFRAWRMNARPDLTIVGPLLPNWLPEKLTPDPQPEVVAGV